jgi:hypothetical protein
MAPGVSPTDEVSFYLMNRGMSQWLGDQSKPSAALNAQHVQYLERSLEARYGKAKTMAMCIELAKAGLANTTLWLGWLRAMEFFGLRWQGVRTV